MLGEPVPNLNFLIIHLIGFGWRNAFAPMQVTWRREIPDSWVLCKVVSRKSCLRQKKCNM